MPHNATEFLDNLRLVQLVKRCRGEDCPKPSEDTMQQAAAVDAGREKLPGECCIAGHDSSVCMPCQEVNLLLQGLLRRLEADGIQLPPGVLESGAALIQRGPESA